MLENRTIPEWKLERYLLGELPSEEMQRIEHELESNPELASRLDELRRLDNEMRAALPPCKAVEIQNQMSSVQKMWEQIKNRISEVFAVEYMKPVLSFGVLLLVVGTVVYFTDVEDVSTDPYIGTKGTGPSLKIYKSESDSVVELKAGEVATPNSLLQIKYLAKGDKFGFIFSVDGNGQITRHLPMVGDEAAILNTEGAEILSSSYELDSAPKFEKFYFITAENQFSLSEIERSAEIMIRKESDSLRLSRSYNQYIHPILKE